MKRKIILNTTIAFAIGILPLLTGCGGGDTGGDTTTTPPAGEAAPAAEDTSNNSATTPPADPASSLTVVQDGAQTKPAQAVAIFLDSLRSGDDKAANGVLTEKARAELGKTSYQMQPLGTPDGQFKIGRVVYPYEDKTVALVECVWTEPAVEQQTPVSMDIVCEVHQEPQGWGISGIGVTIPGTDDALVLDFEDAAGLQATIDAATGQPSKSASNSQANSTTVPARVVSGVNNLPAAVQGTPQNSSPMPQYNNPAGTNYPNVPQASPNMPALPNANAVPENSLRSYDSGAAATTPPSYPNLPLPPSGSN